MAVLGAGADGEDRGEFGSAAGVLLGAPVVPLTLFWGVLVSLIK